jgi:hypothetical protein
MSRVRSAFTVGLAWVFLSAGAYGCESDASVERDAAVPDADASADAQADATSIFTPTPYGELLGCQAASPCAGSPSSAEWLQLGSSTGGIFEFTPGVRCVLTAIRDRTPGVYRHHTASSWTNMASSSNHVVVIHADGSATTAAEHFNDCSGCPPRTRSESPTSHCELQPAAELDRCIALLDDSEATDLQLAECLMPRTDYPPLPWFTTCTLAPARCE